MLDFEVSMSSAGRLVSSLWKLHYQVYVQYWTTAPSWSPSRNYLHAFFSRKSLKSVHIFGILQLRSKVKVPYERRYQEPLEKKYSFMPNSSKFFRSSVTSQKQAWFFLVCLCWSAIYAKTPKVYIFSRTLSF